jgi:predicted phosphodiesterase
MPTRHTTRGHRVGKTAGDFTDDELLTAVAQHGGAKQAAEVLGINDRQVQRRIRRIREMAAVHGIDPWMELDRHRPRPLMGLIRVTGSGLALADLHLPITRFDIIRDAVASAQRHGCTDWCIIAGDLFNFDALSDYFPKQQDHTLQGEIAAGGEVLALLLAVFKRVIVTKGNHDIRLQKALGYRMRFEHSLRMVLPHLTPEQDARLEITGRDYAIVDTELGEWRLCHTRQYSETPLTIPAKIADVHQQHVGGAHRHHHGVTRSRSGKLILELGGAFDTDRTEYLEQWSTTHPRWQPGWVLLHRGMPYLPMLAPCPTCDAA